VTKGSHTGKTPAEKQLYFDSLTHASGDSTGHDNILDPDPMSSDVLQEPEAQIGKRQYRKRKRNQSGFVGHLNKNAATYVVGLLSLIVILLISIGFPISNNQTTILHQMETLKDDNKKIQQDLVNLGDEIKGNDVEIQNKVHDIYLRIQEQALKIEFVEKLLQDYIQ